MLHRRRRQDQLHPQGVPTPHLPRFRQGAVISSYCAKLFFFLISFQGAGDGPKRLCGSLDKIGVLGIEYEFPSFILMLFPQHLACALHFCNDCRRRYHLRFPADYPHSAPLVRFYRPHVQGEFVLPCGAVCTDALHPAAWQAKQSFDAVFRGILYVQGFSGLTATVDSVYTNEAAAHKTTIEWRAKVHSEWQSRPGASHPPITFSFTDHLIGRSRRSK